ncbi:MAG TPA: nucleoside phosphorylase [Anaerolineales bacterium]|jgi:uridine phosphorylase
MNFPNYPEKQHLETLLKAEDLVAYRRKLGRTPAIDPLHGVLLCLERGMPERMRWRIPVRRAGSMNAEVYAVKRSKNPVAILTHFGGGSPMVVELAEELAAMGAKKMILMTWGGTLQADLHPGDIVICSQAIRDDGASQHYLPPGKHIQADGALVGQLEAAIRSRGAGCTTGITWTTDAPYRETREEVRQYQAEGVKVVEMESAGLFTIGQVRGIPTASIVVVMDSLASLEWQAPPGLDEIFRSLELVYSACIEVLAQG